MIDPSSIPTLTADDKRVIKVLLTQSNDWTRKCFEAALVHLVYAHRLAEIDPAMAVFRAITAEEEAATGILRSFKLRKYPGSEQLRIRDHYHKAAVLPFIRTIVKHLSYLKFHGIEEVRLGFSRDEEQPHLALFLVLNGDLKGQVARPTPPLNFRYREGDDQTLPNYRRYFLQVVDQSGYDDVRKYIEAKANERNLLLYASAQGLSRIDTVPDGYLLGQKLSVLTILKAALLVWPYSEIQPFAQEAIQAFVNLTAKVQNEQRCE